MKNFFSRVLIVCGILFPLLSEAAQAEPAQDLQQIKQLLSIMKSEIQELKSRSFVVGSVQQAFLTEAEFQRQMGKNWVLCDGRSVPGSAWERLGYGSSIPNCTGRFLRSAGGAAAPLRSQQDQAVNVSGIKASTVLQTNLNVTVSGSTEGSIWQGDLSGVSSDSSAQAPSFYEGIDSWSNKQVGRDIPYFNRIFGHYHNFTGSGAATGGSWTTTLTTTGDQETRPSNITVNTFIKVN